VGRVAWGAGPGRESRLPVDVVEDEVIIAEDGLRQDSSSIHGYPAIGDGLLLHRAGRCASVGVDMGVGVGVDWSAVWHSVSVRVCVGMGIGMGAVWMHDICIDHGIVLCCVLR